jgi:hypothetical protein
MAAIKIRSGKDSITIWLKQTQAELDKVPRSVAAGINRAAQAGYTAAVREIKKDLGGSAQESIRKGLRLNKAFVSKTGIYEQLQATIEARSLKEDRIPIYDLSPKPRTESKRRPKGPGVSWGPTLKLIPGSFIRKMKSGHVGVFSRIGVFGRRGNLKLEKIAEDRGPSVAVVFGRRKIMTAVKKVISERINIEVQRAIEFFGK